MVISAQYQDNEINYLNFMCQLCPMSLEELSPQERHAHYEHHLNEQATQASSSKALTNIPKSILTTNPEESRHLRPPRLEEKNSPPRENVFWFPAQAIPPPNNFLPGLIPTLKHALLKTHAKGLTTRAILCHEGVAHVATEWWDRGWGCGYRNFLMACTALMSQSVQPLYFPLLDDPTPPGVRNLQFWIEDAWADGFDREGAGQLKHKLIGTSKWIGTAELYVAFVSRGIPAQLVDFPGTERGPAAVTEWIMKYFSPTLSDQKPTDAFNALKGASPIMSTDRMPLVLQHAGHSRTVIGIEVNKKGESNLLVFDPSTAPSKDLRRVALANHSPSFPSMSRSHKNTSSLLDRVLHPRKSSKDRKRRASGSPEKDNLNKTKRVKGGLESPLSGLDDNVVVIDDSEDEARMPETLDSSKVVNFFKVNQNKLGRNDRYQILYFPLDPPLQDRQRWKRRVVTSERVV